MDEAKRYEIKEGSIFSVIYRTGDKAATLTEECDSYYSKELSADDLEDLANKFLALAKIMRAEQKKAA